MPSARRATRQRQTVWKDVKISIHALREEGDLSALIFGIDGIKFLSTPSARRATSQYRGCGPCTPISIHALREEGDTMFASSMPSILNFYPRPPRGGRQARRASTVLWF